MAILIEFGGHGPVVHLAPANGFPLTTYLPIIERLSEQHRVVAVPPRALWDEVGPPPAEPGSWEAIGEDIARGLESHGVHGAILIGHSFGGVASLVAAVRHRSLVRGLCLLDPTILPKATVDRFLTGKTSRWQLANHPLAVAARERRARFASPAEAFAYWRGRPLFANWSDAALERYVDGLLRPEPAGGYGLRWSAAWEAYYYESIYLGAWDEIAKLDPSLPILVIVGGTTDAFRETERERFRHEVPWASIMAIPGHGHLFPQSAPDETLALIEPWVRRVVAGTESGSS